MRKNIIIAFVSIFVLVGCNRNYYVGYSKINSDDNKVICKYIASMATVDFGKTVIIDENTITDYVTKNFNGYEKTMIIANAKIGEEEYYIRITISQTTDSYSVFMGKKE